jgi:hypothetical protein
MKKNIGLHNNFFEKIKKKLLYKVPIFFIHRLAGAKIYQKEKKKVGVVI